MEIMHLKGIQIVKKFVTESMKLTMENAKPQRICVYAGEC